MLLREARRRFEIEFFQTLLLENKWHIETVARKAGICRRYCYKKLDQLGLIRCNGKEQEK
jgi:DNA-binding NtrC family response regulator